MRNPKDEAATTEGRARLDLLEPSANKQTAGALGNGADKYGVRNFYQSSIEARTYVAAMLRHIGAWLDGEDFDPESGFHHLGHVAACVHVVFGAMEGGTFVDDRMPAIKPAELPFSPQIQFEFDGTPKHHTANEIVGRRIEREFTEPIR